MSYIILKWRNPASINGQPSSSSKIRLDTRALAFTVNSPVLSVNGQTGDITLTAADVAADPFGSADAVRSELQSQINEKADAATVNQQIDGINQLIPNFATQTYVLTALTPKASIAYVDNAVAAKADALATSQALATKATTVQLNEVKALAESNELKVGTKAEQSSVDNLSATVTAQGQTLLTKADIAALTTLAQLVNTKADQAYVISEIARITGNAPAALDTLAEIAEQLGNDETQINNLLNQIGNRVRFDAAQSLTTTQQNQARDNINAETKGVAQSLVAAITPASIGAATSDDGAKARSALQSGDVAPVALSGSFSDLVNKSSLFNLVYSAYAVGSNAVIAATDTLGQMLGKLQGQISANTSAIDTKADATSTLQAINTKEPTISTGTISQYWRGDKTWRDFATDVRGTVLTGLSTATSTAITASDTVLVALGKAQALINAANADINSLTLKGMDLVNNGLGQLFSNRFWTAYSYDPLDKPVGTVGSFTLSGVNIGIGDEFIAVEPNRKYLFSYQAKQKASGVVANIYGFIAPYDIDKLQIQPVYYMAQANTLTTLAADLKPGDTVMQLTSAANWNNAGGAANTHLRSMIVWNYTDGRGYKWPANTYSRNWFNNLYNEGAISGNTITLRVPWAGATIPAGTEVSNGSSGGSYMYIGAAGISTPASWTQYSGIVGGVHTSGTTSAATTAFPMMTAFVKLGFWGNRDPSTGTVVPASRSSFGAISFKDLGYPMATQAASTATDVTTLKNDFNALLTKLKNNGLMN